jgi:phage gp46-like protein
VEQTDLESAISISLSAKKRAEGKHGYWADVMNKYPCGSLLWTLERRALSEETVLYVEQHVKDSLQCLVRSNIASRVKVDVKSDKNSNIDVQVGIDDGV